MKTTLGTEVDLGPGHIVLDDSDLQSDLHKMFNWSQDWQMLFNTDKRKVMHFAFNNKEV